MGAAREDLAFDSWGDRCAAWLYRPEAAGGERGPCVVMAHGFSGTREDGLAPFAERFAAAGLAALVFDYRGFGDSEGEPRQWLDVRRERQDWAAAIAFARTLDGVDPDRIVLWGTSFSGGHVIEAAARDARVVAAVAQVPFTDGPRTVAAIPPRTNLALTLAAARDLARSRSGGPPLTVPAVGPPGSVAAMTSPDADPGFHALVSPGSRWRNEVAARVVPQVLAWRPGRAAARVRCPLLVVVATRDAVTPPAPAERAALAAPRGELVRIDAGHFDVYAGEGFEHAVKAELGFLAHVLPARVDGTERVSHPR